MLISFVLCLLAFAAVGIASAWRSRATKADYYLASASVKPWLVGLSAVATNNSGYMFIGVIGYTYAVGLDSVWLMLGWIAGDYLASRTVHRRLRLTAGRTRQASFAGLMANWQGEPMVHLQRLAGAIALVFLIAYAAAQLTAGGKALQVLLGWPQWAGALMGALLVAAYCLAGGLRASIWTDAAQSVVMIVAMALLLTVAVQALGGMRAANSALHQVPGYMDWAPENLALPGLAGMALFILGWLFAGVSVVGQPHIMVRFMSLDASGHMNRARAWYYGWFTAFYTMALCVGLLSKLYLPEASQFDAELALPTMALELLPAALVGVVLAGIFAATMSTADSLVLSCSAAVTHDLLPASVERPMLIRLVTLAVTLAALGLTFVAQASVFTLVIFAWSALASAFAPLLLFLCMGQRIDQTSAILAMLLGLAVAVGWRLAGWHLMVYEALPGILTGLALLWWRRQHPGCAHAPARLASDRRAC